ncbi:MAG: CHAT domain-containing protein, partial [Planctomycetes bacterium]|nr:CHAT domain-containing protein [Planctomycetota bacterium]
DATRARLGGDLAGYSIVHLAAHGYVDSDEPERSGVVLAAGRDDSGFLTIADVLDLRLDADVVFLSACESARGEAVGGEGVESLARAFLFAGARGVVASLWPVADWAAAETTTAFYRGVIIEKRSSAQALRAAKLAIRRSSGPTLLRGIGGLAPEDAPAGAVPAAHPFLWAPFVYSGAAR